MSRMRERASISTGTDVDIGPGTTARTTPATSTDIVRSILPHDIEKRQIRDVSLAPDPYLFKNGIMDENQLLNTKDKRLETFYRKQNAQIDYLLKSVDQHTEEAKEVEETNRLPIKIAVWASLFANFSLCVLQLYAAISSASLSLLATGIDSVFDIGSNILLICMHKKGERLDESKWPVGGSRLQTIGNIVYGSLMGAVNLVVVVESTRSIVAHKSNELNVFHIPSLVAVGAALGVKFLLFLYCYTIRKSSSQVQILWEDHRNDLFINGFGLLMSAGGSRLKWFLDPMGAIVIGLGVIAAWVRTIYFQFELLAGKSAPRDFIQFITYKAITFSPEIEKIDTVKAYHSGPEYFVEVDVVMPADTPLWKAHDVSQLLQDKLEVLPNVGRAFVHVDHETTHQPEHRKVQ